MRFWIFSKQEQASHSSPALDIAQLQYLRKHKWGDKLFDKLSPEEKQEYQCAKRERGNAFRASAKRFRSPTRLSLTGTSRKTQGSLHVNPSSREEETEIAAKDGVEKQGDSWIVPEVGTFRHRASFTFTGTELPPGLRASNNEERNNEGPYRFRFDPTNVKVTNGFCELRIPGGQDGTQGPLSCAEISTDEHKILHASVRFNAMFSAVKGACHGAFFYHNEEHECDMEYLTDPSSNSNNGARNPIPVWYSNQAVVPGLAATNAAHPSSANIGELHAYRIDWTSEFTAFYIDGLLQEKLTSNVPLCPGAWFFNNWANGDPNWSVGPPTEDCVFKIKDITMYYNKAQDFRPFNNKSQKEKRSLKF